jgi:hypothetical protein
MPRTRMKQSKLNFANGGSEGNTSQSSRPSRTLRSNQKSTKQTNSKKGSQLSEMTKAKSSPLRPSGGGIFGRGRIRRAASDTEDVESDDEISQNQKKSNKRTVDDEETEESESEPQQKKPSSSKRNKRVIEDEEEESELGEPETSDDGGMNSTPMRKPRKGTAIVIENSDEDSEEDAITRPGRSGGSSGARLKRLRPHVTAESESESDGEASVHKKRRRQVDDSDEAEEIAAELDDLRDSSPINTPTQNKAAKRREALEQLKRRRLRRAKGDTMISSDEENEEVVSDEGQYRYVETRGDNDDEYESDFLDDDMAQETTLGAPDSSMPFKFSRLASANLQELFSHAVDWLIQNKINPAFERDSEIYDTVWRRLNDELSGLAASKFKSSVWNRDFLVDLEARPDMQNGEDYADSLAENCQACNRGNHPATFSVIFQGQPYDPNSLQEVEQDLEEYDHEFDYKGRQIPHVRTWYLGKTCFDNAQHAHTLAHWKNSLNDAVLTMLRAKGVLQPHKIVERDGWSVLKKKKWTQEFVQQLDEEGIIGQLWILYKDFVDTARKSKVSLRNF